MKVETAARLRSQGRRGKATVLGGEEVVVESVGTPTRLATYLDWNDALAAAIFRPEMAGREVLLCVTDDLIEQVGGEGRVQDFIDAVRSGPPWVDPSLGLCQRALRTQENWRDRGLRYPPYIGYLALFVLAVGLQGDFAAHTYHARLRTLLKMEDVGGGALPSFGQMRLLWDDLELWSIVDEGGELGIFTVRFAGESTHVRLPKAQAVLIESERKALPAIFAAAELDPSNLPPDRELARLLKIHGEELRGRTIDLLADYARGSELSALLLDAVRGELEDWDGELVAPVDTVASAISHTTTARVFLQVDSLAGTARTTLRIHPKADFPEGGLTLESTASGVTINCHESRVPGWSTPLKIAGETKNVNAADFDWSKDHFFTDVNERWRVRLPATRVRIFVRDIESDLPGLIEVRAIEANTPFHLAVSHQAVAAVEGWMASGEVDLHRVQISGLPPGWSLFKSTSGAASDNAVRQTLPELSLPSTTRIRFLGGIRSRPGNAFAYFSFAPPRVVVEGGAEDDTVQCSGRGLKRMPGCNNVFELPRGLETAKQLRVEVERNGFVTQRSLILETDFVWQLEHPAFVTDSIRGTERILEEGAESAQAVGPRALGSSGGEFPIRPSITSDDRKFFIGRQPGAIVTVFREYPDIDWDPVWIVDMRRRGRVTYCGTDLRNSAPQDEAIGSAGDRTLWKKILWFRRKRIHAPDHPELKRLWDEFTNRAAHVDTRR